MAKRALITGITGQDGAYLARLLLAKGYEVHGLKRRSSSFNTGRLEALRIFDRVHLHHGDMSDGMSLARILAEVRPDEVYNLAAQSHVAVSFECPEYTADADALGTLRLLEAIRSLRLPCHIYQASTSELFGDAPAPQSEATPFRPRSPYACAKLYAHSLAVNYREAWGMHISCGILFNHESPLRGETFVTRKITRGLARIAAGLERELVLGNLDAVRDWGHAADYVRGMWLMLQQEDPGDYVMATGEAHTVREFCAAAMRHVFGRERWELIRTDPRYLRPTEVPVLRGDARRARERLGWRPEIGFDALVAEMVLADFEELGLAIPQEEAAHV